ncbi:MAG: hypothetical protein IKK11_05015, partial [Oscillospiraceae bacterium]|nr:hypothetical protein [Oscillospiraceae bacterium]
MYKNNVNGPEYPYDVEVGTAFGDGCAHGDGYACLKVTINLPCDHDSLEDDGDCTTAVVCPVCFETIVAAQDHAWADDNDTTCENAGCEVTRVPAKAVAVLNGVYYNTLAEAYEAAVNGDEIVLLKNAAGTGIVIQKSITIDFGGFIYTINTGVGDVPSNGLQIRKEAGEVTLKNGRLQINGNKNDL